MSQKAFKEHQDSKSIKDAFRIYWENRMNKNDGSDESSAYDSENDS